MRFLLTCFCLLILSCNAQNNIKNYTEAYDLTFKMGRDSAVLCPWRENAAYSNYAIPVPLNGLFTKVYFKQSPFIDRLKTEFEQRILLPGNNEKKGKVLFECKGTHIALLYLSIEGLNDKEEPLCHDTLFVKPDTVLKQFSETISFDKVSLLNIKIYAEGIENENADISFGKLDINIGKKNIDNYILKEIPDIESIHADANSMLNDTVFDNRKLLVLGESVHHNQTINDFFAECVLSNIKKNKCKLLILEMPMEKSLKYNRYINEKNFHLDRDDADNGIPRLLLDSIKSCNLHRKKEDRIMFFGMDYNHILTANRNTALDILDYLIIINQKYHSALIDDLLLELTEKDWDDAISYLRDNKDNLIKILDIGDYECIRHILEISKNVGMDGIDRFIKRDSIMFVNAKFLIDTFAKGDKNIIIKAHAAHINVFSTFPAVPCTPFGVYMKEEYRDMYDPVLVLVAEGNTILYDDKHNLIEYSLSSPINGSIEKYLNLSGLDKTVIPVSENLNRLVYSRFVGSGKNVREFFPFNLYKRFSSIVFLKGVDSKHDAGKIISSFDNMSDKSLQNIKNRNKILEEIKKKGSITNRVGEK